MKKHLFFALYLLVGIALFHSCNNETEKSSTQADTETHPEKVDTTTSEFAYGYNLDSFKLVLDTIQRNQSLSDILQPYDISSKKIFEISEASKDVFDVRKLSANKPFEIICSNDSSGKPFCFIYHPNEIDYVIYKLDGDPKVSLEHFDVQFKEKTITGVIENSMYQTLIDQGASPKLAIEMSEVYAWQIDFFGIQKGDRFKILYEDMYVKDRHVGVGKILAAEFQHYDTTYYAVHYEKDSINQYYDEKGNSLRKAFLKAPLNFTRISSRFSHSRLHPILKIRRPHHGVDYAAPSGTPVQTIGDGTVIQARYAGGAGNYVKIKHNSVYTTGYMHLLKFGEGVRNGTRVRQGQVIGYVGSTGLSTGPHLDFRVWKNGTPIDPLHLNPPPAEPLDSTYIADFMIIQKERLQHLNTIPYIEIESK